MRYLFYIVHPSKFHLFKFTINELKKKHSVDIVINSKDVLEDLIIKEGWNYYNLFPKGRNISKRPSIIKSAYKFILTIFRLELFLISNKRYDKFITDDALVVNAWIRRKPSYIFNDNDVQTIKVNKVLFYFSTKIISPHTTNLGSFNSKKIPFWGNKAIAHLHPKYFTPSNRSMIKLGHNQRQYCIVRLSHLNATHDVMGNNGITNPDLETIINIIDKRLEIIILSEREIPNKYLKYSYNGDPSDIFNLIFYSKFVISDSGTVATEASVLGVPNILINNLAKDIGVHTDLKNNNLQHYFDSFDECIEILDTFIQYNKLNYDWHDAKNKYIDKCSDLNKLFLDEFLI